MKKRKNVAIKSAHSGQAIVAYISTMKKLMVIVVAALCMLNTVQAQIATEPRTEEYAIVRVAIESASGKIAPSAATPNPFLEMEGAGMELKDYVRDSKGAKFDTVADILNYMNKFGWSLHSSDVVPAGTGNYLLLYNFKRKSKK